MNSIQIKYKMDTNDPHRLILDLSDKVVINILLYQIITLLCMDKSKKV